MKKPSQLMSLLAAILIFATAAGRMYVRMDAPAPASSGAAESGMGYPVSEASIGVAAVKCLITSRSSRIDPSAAHGARRTEVPSATAETQIAASRLATPRIASWIGRDHFRRGPPASLSV